MDYDTFVDKVKERARLGTTGEAVTATRATLETLSERLFFGLADNVAAQLPREIGHFMKSVKTNRSFRLEEFFDRVTEREAVDKAESVYHARAVIDVLLEAVTPQTVEKVKAQLPDEYGPLFDTALEEKLDIS